MCDCHNGWIFTIPRWLLCIVIVHHAHDWLNWALFSVHCSLAKKHIFLFIYLFFCFPVAPFQILHGFMQTSFLLTKRVLAILRLCVKYCKIYFWFKVTLWFDDLQNVVSLTALLRSCNLRALAGSFSLPAAFTFPYHYCPSSKVHFLMMWPK